MILYKTIALRYGRYLDTGQPGDKYDLVARLAPTEHTRAQRQGILDDISAARIYLLDHRAANYLDSLRMDVQGMTWKEEQDIAIEDYVREIDFPQDLIWVEFDSRKLWEDRIARGLSSMSRDAMNDWHQRGFLFDNRSADVMTVQLFSALNDRHFLDSPVMLVLKKTQGGRLDFGAADWLHQDNVISALQIWSGDQQYEVKKHIDRHKSHLTYEMVIGFMLFAALAAREDDLLAQESPSLSPAQAKTARKFGKTWMTETLRSHVTIRIGPAGECHLTERDGRRRFEEARASGRATPTEHWVSEHERRYASGKVIRVRAHKRGREAGRELPVRVMGPRLES